jgi:hypothetical protein
MTANDEECLAEIGLRKTGRFYAEAGEATLATARGTVSALTSTCRKVFTISQKTFYN